MKKSLNFLLILSIIVLVLTLVINVSSIVFNDFDLFPMTSEIVENVENSESGDPGAGWLLLFTPFSIVGDFALAALLLVCVVIFPLWCCGIMIILQAAARLFQIGQEKKWKDIIGKVLTVISIITQVVLCIVLAFCLICNLDISKLLLFVSIIIHITSVVLFIKEFIKMNKTNIQVVINQ